MPKRVGPRYAILPADAVTDSALSGPDLKVLALLGRHIDRKGWCTRAQKRMADELSIARGTLQRSLGRLVDAGYVEVEQVQRRDGGQAANRYHVILDRLASPNRTTRPSRTISFRIPSSGFIVPTSRKKRFHPYRLAFRQKVWAKTGGACVYCGSSLVPDGGMRTAVRRYALIIDHVHPLALGGNDDLANCLPSCQPCNTRKGAMPLARFLEGERSRRGDADLVFHSMAMAFLDQEGS